MYSYLCVCVSLHVYVGVHMCIDGCTFIFVNTIMNIKEIKKLFTKKKKTAFVLLWFVFGSLSYAHTAFLHIKSFMDFVVIFI